jgi:hypothetical protein
MAWNSRRILVDVIEGTMADAELAARKMQGELRCRHDDPRWQCWAGSARIEARGHTSIGIDIAKLPKRKAVVS